MSAQPSYYPQWVDTEAEAEAGTAAEIERSNPLERAEEPEREQGKAS